MFALFNPSWSSRPLHVSILCMLTVMCHPSPLCHPSRYLPSDAWMFDFLMAARAGLPRFTPLDVVATAHALASLHSSKTYAPPEVSSGTQLDEGCRR